MDIRLKNESEAMRELLADIHLRIEEYLDDEMLGKTRAYGTSPITILSSISARIKREGYASKPAEKKEITMQQFVDFLNNYKTTEEK